MKKLLMAMLVVVGFSFFSIVSPVAMGQDGAPARKLPAIKEVLDSTASNEFYKRLPPEDQMQLIEESSSVYEYCNKRQLFSSFHDCQCVAARFFDARLLNPDPEINIINMGDKVAKDCPNIPGVAGYALNECQSSYAFRIKVGLDEFCNCYARTYADLYKDDPRAVLPHMSRIGTKAILSCDAKGLPSPLNPDRD